MRFIIHFLLFHTPLIQPCTASLSAFLSFSGFVSYFSTPCFSLSMPLLSFSYFPQLCPPPPSSSLFSLSPPSVSLPLLSYILSPHLSLSLSIPLPFYSHNHPSSLPLHPSIPLCLSLSSAEDKEVKAKRITVAV